MYTLFGNLHPPPPPHWQFLSLMEVGIRVMACLAQL
jgi:hypothetical protein